MTGPWTVVLKRTRPSPLIVPASTEPILRHLPLYLYFVFEPPQSTSANSSIRSDPADVRLQAKSCPRPLRMLPGVAGGRVLLADDQEVARPARRRAPRGRGRHRLHGLEAAGVEDHAPRRLRG